jgi:predicted nucleic acid-binding protein
MSRIFWDTNLFLYLLQSFGEPSRRAADLRRRMLERGDELLTSALTMGEVLVHPVEHKNDGVRADIERAVPAGATVLPFDARAAGRFAEIRAAWPISASDAIQLACASVANCDLFVTNDDRLNHTRVPGVHFVQSLQRTVL